MTPPRKKSEVSGGIQTADSAQEMQESLASRLRSARDTLGLTQREAAQKASMPLPSYKDYEAGNRIPGGEALELLIQAGINANWLLTGEGPMLMSGLTMPPASLNLDWNALAEVIAAIEQRLKTLGLTLSADKKAHLIGLIYDFNSAGRGDADTIDRFIKLVTD